MPDQSQNRTDGEGRDRLEGKGAGAGPPQASEAAPQNAHTRKVPADHCDTGRSVQCGARLADEGEPVLRGASKQERLAGPPTV